MAGQLNLAALAGRGKPKDVKRTAKDLDKDRPPEV